LSIPKNSWFERPRLRCFGVEFSTEEKVLSNFSSAIELSLCSCWCSLVSFFEVGDKFQNLAQNREFHPKHMLSISFIPSNCRGVGESQSANQIAFSRGFDVTK
jgi:hypothetical protein